MGQPAAKQGDTVVAVDTHIFMIPAAAGAPVPTPLPSPFNGILQINLSTNVMITGMPAATVGSQAVNTPPHLPQGGPFQKPPTNLGEIMTGSATVLINGKPAARAGDTARTCNDPADLPVGSVVAAGTVLIG
ncbi:MAG TPA: PAAR domain-containing protein [Tepidiformaceae bacterium]|nr:PAAR domain-containing protein [Tepidiformaceae bacterium]HSE45071.1 PAAR domain-containing protein [Gemmatimonadales bacterium]